MTQKEDTNAWPRLAVFGAGAVGCYFGGMLARAGAPVTLIGRPAHVEAIRRAGLFIESIHFQEHVRVEAATDVSAVREAGIVLFCVKTLDNESAAREIAPHLAPGAVVVSLQNGVDNVGRIRAATGIEALPSVVYVAAAMAGPGHIKHSGRGQLVFGVLRSSPNPAGQREQIAQLADLFHRAGVPCRISENLEGDLWVKLILNCAGNSVTAIGRTSYGQVSRNEFARKVMAAAAEEGIAVARATGVELPDVDLVATGLKFAADLGDATSSTAQDILRGKRTEIESLNGYIARRGAELGVPTPVNFTLYGLIRLLEESAAS